MDKICPLMSIVMENPLDKTYLHKVECLGEKCAWWSNRGCCIILDLVDKMYE